jgi:mxaJ protein
MFSSCRERVLVRLAIVCTIASGSAQGAERDLRVCADPDNLPYSHENRSGFENRIAEVVATELNAQLTYTWLPQRRGFVRKTLNAGLCDVIMGVPADFELTRTTRPYYHSTYVFVQRRDRAHLFTGFDDPQLRNARIGVQLIGDDMAATPPAHVLAARGITKGVIGYTVYGERPQADRMIAALAGGELDVALMWGPQAAYFARQQSIPLAITAVPAPRDAVPIPFEFAISMGVRKGDLALQEKLDSIIARRHREIQAILASFALPQTRLALGASESSGAR